MFTLQYKLIALAVILVLLGGYYVYAEARITSLKKHNISLQSDLEHSKAAIFFLEEQRDRQNREISLLTDKNADAENILRLIIANSKKINIVNSSKASRADAILVQNQINQQIQEIIKKLINETTHN
jgi:hypothetical protein